MGLRLLLFLIISFVASCSSKPVNHSSIELAISPQNQIKIVSFKQTIDLNSQSFASLKKGSSLIQLQFVDSKKQSVLYAIPELYLQPNTRQKFILELPFDSIAAIYLFEMNGASGHYTLKNAQLIDSLIRTNND